MGDGERDNKRRRAQDKSAEDVLLSEAYLLAKELAESRRNLEKLVSGRRAGGSRLKRAVGAELIVGRGERDDFDPFGEQGDSKEELPSKTSIVVPVPIYSGDVKGVSARYSESDGRTSSKDVTRAMFYAWVPFTGEGGDRIIVTGLWDYNSMPEIATG